jgi:hypothetical protein
MVGVMLLIIITTVAMMQVIVALLLVLMVNMTVLPMGVVVMIALIHLLKIQMEAVVAPMWEMMVDL